METLRLKLTFRSVILDIEDILRSYFLINFKKEIKYLCKNEWKIIRQIKTIKYLEKKFQLGVRFCNFTNVLK